MAINVLVTDSNIEYTNFKVIPSVRAIKGLSRIDNFVYHNSEDSPEEVIDVIRSVEMKSITYLRDGDLMNASLKLYIQGLGGQLVEDEFYLSSSEAMENITEALQSGKEMLSTNSLMVLDDFFARVVNGDTDFKKPYITSIKAAVEKIKKGYTKQDTEYQTVVKTAVNMVESVSADLTAVRSAHQELRDQAEEIQQKLESAKGAALQSSSRIFHFSPVIYKERKPAIVIKELGNVPFLLSFTMGLMEYMIRKESLNTRLIIILPVGENNERIYGDKLPDDVDFISSNNHGSKARYMSRITYTNHPISSVINKLFRSNHDSYIVLDRSDSTLSPLIRGDQSKYIRTFTAVQSGRMFERFPKQISRKTSFSSLTDVKGTMFTIPLIEEYGTKVPRRIHTYLEVCGDMYAKLVGRS